MENLVYILSFLLIWLPLCVGCLFFIVLLVVYYYKSLDYEQKYLMSLDEDTRIIYNRIRLNKRMPFGNVFKRKAVVHNEDK